MGYDADVIENTMGGAYMYIYIYECINVYEGLQGMRVALQPPLHFHEKNHPI